MVTPEEVLEEVIAEGEEVEGKEVEGIVGVVEVVEEMIKIRM